MKYYVYLLKCADESLYTGITTDVNRRIQEHNGELPGGAKYTAARGPVELVYQAEFDNRSEASKEEYRIKQLKVEEKRELVKQTKNETS